MYVTLTATGEMRTWEESGVLQTLLSATHVRRRVHTASKAKAETAEEP